MQDRSNSCQKVNLEFNGNKIRWLADSNVTPTNTFCIGSGEKRVFNYYYIYFLFSLKKN